MSIINTCSLKRNKTNIATYILGYRMHLFFSLQYEVKAVLFFQQSIYDKQLNRQRKTTIKTYVHAAWVETVESVYSKIATRSITFK